MGWRRRRVRPSWYADCAVQCRRVRHVGLFFFISVHPFLLSSQLGSQKSLSLLWFRLPAQVLEIIIVNRRTGKQIQGLDGLQQNSAQPWHLSLRLNCGYRRIKDTDRILKPGNILCSMKVKYKLKPNLETPTSFKCEKQPFSYCSHANHGKYIKAMG